MNWRLRRVDWSGFIFHFQVTFHVTFHVVFQVTFNFILTQNIHNIIDTSEINDEFPVVYSESR